MSAFELQLWGGALLFLAFFVLLAVAVARDPVLRLDGIAVAVRGHATALARVLTYSGYGLPITCLGVLCAGAALYVRAGYAETVFLFCTQAASQGLINALKLAFARARPLNGLGRKEGSFSFPSGHASTAVVLYGGAAHLTWASTLPAAVRIPIGTALLAWAFGVAWSRLALAAHFFSDVLGGLLFGFAFVMAALACCAHAHIVVH